MRMVARQIRASKKCRRCGVDKVLGLYSLKLSTFDKRESTCRQCRNQKAYETYRRMPRSHYKAQQLRRYYGLSLEEYQQLLDSQSTKCKICSNILKEGKATHVDHCHTTGVIRGLLCSNCNTALGLAKENLEILAKMMRYLKTNGNY